MSLEPYVLVFALMAVVAAAVMVRMCTPVLLAALIYVGNFKAIPAQGLSLTDPTFIVLMMCCSGLLIDCLFMFSGRDLITLAELFAGQSRGLLLFVLFVVTLALSEFYSAAPESGLIKLERIAVFGTVCVFAPLIFFKRTKDLDLCLTTCIALSLVLSIRNLTELFHPTAGVLAGTEDITRIGDSELIAAAILIVIYQRRFAARRLLQSACIAILAVGLAASAARSAALALLLSLAISTVALRSHGSPWLRRKVLLGTLAIAVTGVAVLWIGRLPAARAKLAHKENELGHLMTGTFLPGGTAEQRMNFYRQSLVAISERPIFGWGIGGWAAFSLGLDVKAFPHNFVLEAAVEQGVVGCGLLLAFLIATASKLRDIIRQTGLTYGFLMPALLLTVITGLVTGELDSRLLWFWCGTIFAVSRMTQAHIQQAQVATNR